MESHVTKLRCMAYVWYWLWHTLYHADAEKAAVDHNLKRCSTPSCYALYILSLAANTDATYTRRWNISCWYVALDPHTYTLSDNMDTITFIPEPDWYPLASLGLTHPFFGMNTETLIYTWAAMAIIMILSIGARIALSYPYTQAGYITRSLIRSLMDLTQESFGSVILMYYGFISTLFIFIFLANTLMLFPGLEEPTQDINTTCALSLISFLFTQVETARTHGLFGYLQEYIIWPFRVRPEHAWTMKELVYAPARLIGNIAVGCVALPFELLSKIASVISLSLRLFGNILGGSIIAKVITVGLSGSIWRHMLAIATGLNILVALFFGLFEAFIQAFVFTVLSLTYLNIGTQS